MFFGQEGVKRNLKRSYNYFKQALEVSDQKDDDLEYSVAIMKYKGSGTQKDPEGARVMFEKSLAESGANNQNENAATLVGLAVYHLD